MCACVRVCGLSVRPLLSRFAIPISARFVPSLHTYFPPPPFPIFVESISPIKGEVSPVIFVKTKRLLGLALSHMCVCEPCSFFTAFPPDLLPFYFYFFVLCFLAPFCILLVFLLNVIAFWLKYSGDSLRDYTGLFFEQRIFYI